jgi:glycosyltransferase involved in cell wall biosynthesis
VRLLLVVNQDAWAIGTLARFLALGVPEQWEVSIENLWNATKDAEAFRRKVASSDIVHWMLHRVVLDPPAWNAAAVNVCSVHHIEAYENTFAYLSRCQGIIVHAERYQRVLQECGIEPSRIACIPQPVDESFFATGRRRVGMDAQRTVNAPRRVGFFSTAEYGLDRKGIDLLPEVLGGVSGVGHNVKLIVTGFKWRDTLARKEFAGLPFQVTLAPSYFDMPKLYSTLDAYLCLSRVEGGPMPVFEAAACGVPVISTPVGRVPELLVPNESYVSIPISDAPAAAAALRNLVHHPRQLRQYARRAYESVSASLSVRGYQSRHYDFYRGLTGSVYTAPRLTRDAIERAKQQWRAADSINSAKRLWTDRQRLAALHLALRGLSIDPRSSAFWGTVLRRFTFARRGRPR